DLAFRPTCVGRMAGRADLDAETGCRRPQHEARTAVAALHRRRGQFGVNFCAHSSFTLLAPRPEGGASLSLHGDAGHGDRASLPGPTARVIVENARKPPCIPGVRAVSARCDGGIEPDVTGRSGGRPIPATAGPVDVYGTAG